MPVVEFARIPTGSAETVRRQAREQLGQLTPGLRVIAEDVMGPVSSIDLLAVDPDGGVVAVLIATGEDEEPALLTRAIAHRAWIAERVGDWCKLAPELGIAPKRPALCVLLAPNFGDETRLAARALGAESIHLVRYSALRAGEETGLVLDPLAAPSPTASDLVHAPREEPATPAPSPLFAQATGPLPEFRSNLAERDLRLQRPATPTPAG